MSEEMINNLIQVSNVQFEIKNVSAISALAELLIEKKIITNDEYDKKYFEIKEKIETEQKE